MFSYAHKTRKFQFGKSLFVLFKLAVVQRGICAALGKQLGVISLFDDISVIHEQDTVRVADRGKAVRNYKRGPALHMRDAIALPISASVLVSTLEVASSSISIGGSQRNTRAIVRS